MKAPNNATPSNRDSCPLSAKRIGKIVITEPIIMSRLIFSVFVEIPRERKVARPITSVALITFDPKATDITKSPAPIAAEDMDMNSSGMLVAIASKTKAVVNSETPKTLAATVMYLITKRPAITRTIKDIRKTIGLGSIQVYYHELRSFTV